MSAIDVSHAIAQADLALGTAGLRPDNILRRELRETGAAVAELIEADQELDMCEAMLGFAVRPNDPKSPEEWEQDSRWRDLRDAVKAAKKRRATALANIGAAP